MNLSFIKKQWTDKEIENSYTSAKEQYANLGVDTEKAMKILESVAISLHCWQGDDVGGFESSDEGLSGGIAVTGNYPGKASTPDELRQDLEKAYELLPGKHRLNLHAMYGEFGGKKVDRVDISEEHFKGWASWAKELGIGIDFNPTCFAHDKAADGFTLSNTDAGIRDFWIEHCIASRKIGAYFGRELGTPAVTNLWIPDGFKDTPVNRLYRRELLKGSLDKVFAADVSKKENLDAVECKLFGIGSESCVIGSHEFYLGYAVKNDLLLCLDAGHFHPTEVISDKISSVSLYVEELLLHVSRGVRWDSDHVVVLSDELRAIAEEIVRNDLLKRVHIGLDFFDASINRIAAWTIGTRCMIKAVLMALLEPTHSLQELEKEGDFTTRLAVLEELKTLPSGAVWDYYCLKQGTKPGFSWMADVEEYEKSVLSKRS